MKIKIYENFYLPNSKSKEQEHATPHIGVWHGEISSNVISEGPHGRRGLVTVIYDSLGSTWAAKKCTRAAALAWL